MLRFIKTEMNKSLNPFITYKPQYNPSLIYNAIQNNKGGFVINPDKSASYMGIDTFTISDKIVTWQKPEINKKEYAKFCFGSMAGALALAGLSFLAIKDGRILKNLPFNQRKLLNKIPTAEELDKVTKSGLMNIKNRLSFDESTITKDKITDMLCERIPKNSSSALLRIYEMENRAMAERIFRDKKKLHIYNLLRGYGEKIKNKSAKKEYNTRCAYIALNSTDKYSIEHLEYLLAYGRKYDMGARSIVQMAEDPQKIMRLEGLFKTFRRKLSLRQKIMGGECLRIKTFDSKPDEINNLLIQSEEITKYLASIKKGTLTRSAELFSLKRLIGDKNINIRQIRKFYENIDKKHIRCISLHNIGKLVSIDEMNSIKTSKYINSIPENLLKRINNGSELFDFVDYREFHGINNINELTIAQKKILMRKLISQRKSDIKRKNKFSNIKPSSIKEYNLLLEKLSRSIGVDTKPLSKEEIENFNLALKRITAEIQDIDLNEATIEMPMNRERFTQRVMRICKGLDEKEKRKVGDYFGFEITDETLKGYPIDINNGAKLSEIKDEKTKEVIEKLRPVVNRFADAKLNKVSVIGASKQFSEDINEILKAFPELRSIIGKKQHNTHAFTLDIHTLKVLQNVCSNPNFEKLPEKDKKLLSIASLLHDITKAEGKIDSQHPEESAFDAFYIIQKLNLEEQDQLKIYELIKTHNWLQRLNNEKDPEMVENIAQDIAFDTRRTNTFELAKILCEADLKSVKKDSRFFEAHKGGLETMSTKVDRYLKMLKRTQIYLPQTKIPKASEIKNGTTITKNGITNTVIYMNEADFDLSKYGFEEGTTKGNLASLVHALTKEEDLSKVDAFSIIDSEALLSTSYMNPREYRVFRPQGLILDVETNDIHAGYFQDFGTGYSKEIELLKSDYLFRGKRKETLGYDKWRSNRTIFRNYISNCIKEELNLNNKEYIQMIEKIQSAKSMTDVEKIDPKIADGLKRVFEAMDVGKRSGARRYNEMLISRPKVQGVFAYDTKFGNIPKFLRKYAQDNDLVILIYGNH